MPAFPETPFGQAFEHRIGACRIEQFVFGNEFVHRTRRNEIEQLKRAPSAAEPFDRLDQRAGCLEPARDLLRIDIQMLGDQRFA